MYQRMYKIVTQTFLSALQPSTAQQHLHTDPNTNADSELDVEESLKLIKEAYCIDPLLRDLFSSSYLFESLLFLYI